MIEQYITSAISGRIRLRHPSLRQACWAEQLRKAADFLPGIRALEINPRTGSLLLQYDPASLSQEMLIEIAEAWLQQLPPPVKTSLRTSSSFTLSVLPDMSTVFPVVFRGRRMLRGVGRARLSKTVNRGMLVSLAASLALAAVGRIKGHVVVGGVFLVCTALHLYLFRNRL